MNIATVQAEIIYKAFMFVLNNTDEVEVPEKYHTMFDAILNHSMHDTDVSDVLDNLEVFYNYLKGNTDYLEQEIDNDEDDE